MDWLLGNVMLGTIVLILGVVVQHGWSQFHVIYQSVR